MSIIYRGLYAAVSGGKPAVLVTVLAGPHLGGKLLVQSDQPTVGSLGDAMLDKAAQEQALHALTVQQSARIEVNNEDLFFDVFLPPKRLFIVGAVHTAVALVTFAKTLGYRTTVLDARSAFATPERFAHADGLIVQWPADALADQGLDEASSVVVLTHDPKVDNPALMLALDSPARYVGALGSRRTHASRCEELRGLGASDEQLARIHAPIGLDLGGRRPEEIALAIMAEIVATEHNRTF